MGNPTQTKQQQHFRRMICALTMAAPFGLAARFEHDLAHCVEASVCGAEALAARKIKARAVPCALVGTHRSAGIVATVGLNAKDLYQRLSPEEGPLPTFEAWAAGQNLPADDSPMHMIIEARYHGERAIIDLTIGQLRQAHGIEVGFSTHYIGEGWQEFDVPDWTLRYFDSPHAEEIQRRTGGYRNPGLVDDLGNLMDAALGCGLDQDRFFQALEVSQPEAYAQALRRLTRFAALAPPQPPEDDHHDHG